MELAKDIQPPTKEMLLKGMNENLIKMIEE